MSLFIMACEPCDVQPDGPKNNTEAKLLKDYANNNCYWYHMGKNEGQPTCNKDFTKCIFCFSDGEMRCVTFDPNDCIERKAESVGQKGKEDVISGYE